MNGNWAEAWAEAAYNQGITSGCSTNPRNFCPNNSVTRDMNAVLLNTTFQLFSLYTYSGTWHKYYFAGTTRVATRTCSGNSGTACTAPTYFLSDHLGSTSVSVNNVGTLVSTMLYSPWGTVRYSSGTTSTPYQYTGQFSNMSDFGLLFFNARWVDPVIGRFSSPDSIIPESQGTQAWDRYAFVNNNPLRYTDSSGHCVDPLTWTVIGIGVVAIVLYTGIVVYSSPQTQELGKRFAENFSANLEDAVESVTAVFTEETQPVDDSSDILMPGGEPVGKDGEQGEHIREVEEGEVTEIWDDLSEIGMTSTYPGYLRWIRLFRVEKGLV